MPDLTLILVCDSQRPKIHGKGCCSDKGSEQLFDAFSRALSLAGLENRVQLRTFPCMSNCLSGISVKVMHDNTLYGQVKETDIPEILAHAAGGLPVKRLISKPVSRLWE